MPATVIASSVAAQTLTEPTPTTKSSWDAGTEARQACATYGPGFVQMPGSDAYIKLGGFVTIQGGISSGH
jgi:hypothetical protein